MHLLIIFNLISGHGVVRRDFGLRCVGIVILGQLLEIRQDPGNLGAQVIGCEQLFSCLRLLFKLCFGHEKVSLERRHLHLLLTDVVGQLLSLGVDEQLLRVELLAHLNWR